MNLFDLQDIDLGSPKLHTIENFSQTISHENLVILTLIGAELAGGRFCPPPIPGRVILNPIPGHRLIGIYILLSFTAMPVTFLAH